MAESCSVQSSSETESRAREQSAEIVESASGGGESSSSSARSVGLLLVKLRCPKSSDLARKRQVDHNPRACVKVGLPDHPAHQKCHSKKEWSIS